MFVIHKSVREALEAEGLAVVPKEPTKAMIEAARHDWQHKHGPQAHTLYGEHIVGMYRAMVAAGSKT